MPEFTKDGLPVVSQNIKGKVVYELESDGKLFLNRVYETMQGENPMIYNIIEPYAGIMGRGNQDETDAIRIAAIAVYEMLRAQSEANQMGEKLPKIE